MYQPKYVIGVNHSIRFIDPVLKFLEDKVSEGIRVGTEAYDHPLTHMDFWARMDSEFPQFYNAVGDFVKSRKALYVPLQKFLDFENYWRIHFDETFREEFERRRGRLADAFSEAGIRTGIISPWDLVFDDQGAVSAEETYARLQRRLNLKDGIDTYEDRDDTLVELTKEQEPEYIVVGWEHLPALLVEYPDMPIKIIGV